MSEVLQIGRNPVYIVTLFIFNLGILLTFRFLTGLVGSPVLATGGASIGDMYSPKKQIYDLWPMELMCEPEVMVVMIVLIRTITLNFTELMVFLLNVYIALIYGLLYIWFESFPVVFIEMYHFNLGQQGPAFLGILVGAIVILICFLFWLYLVQEKHFDDNGELSPEKRLPPAMVGAFFVPVCLFWFLEFPLFAHTMGAKLGVNWASSLLVFLGIAFIPIPFVLYRFEERLRNISRHARKNI
ncbi:hypothetical protein K469DRAFT_723628 [Zopfia rhizophila CBS 207.26]|uniref:Uncharacterized protein n=1 Tax=Zopfia rhizophila CBS 207.26 TaxID=1314779 RepID=A0A6A6EF76_9PEZI|nr:hypothetical protein K469DRAFT_723628 [Zopfia rhizophila CBS 207.26]